MTPVDVLLPLIVVNFLATVGLYIALALAFKAQEKRK